MKTTLLPEKVPKAFQKLIDNAESKNALALKREIYMSEEETVIAPYETPDPLGEANYRVTENAVHQYKNRLLILTTGKCLGYCRYCFRREFTAREKDFLTETELQPILAYLQAHPEITEVLLSGGDPLSASFDSLKFLIEKIRSVSKNIIIRLCTRGIVFAPELFTEKMVSFLQSAKPLWIIPHINHVAELGPEQVACIERCVNAGLPLHSQTVLLRGVNDNPETLAELFNTLVRYSVKPGYLFQLDTAYGTSHFAVPFYESLALWKKLIKLVSGLSRPEFAVDLLQGGGKFSLSAVALHDSILSISENGFAVKGSNGKTLKYMLE